MFVSLNGIYYYYYFVSDSGILSKPKELIHQDLYYSYARGQTAVLACNVQSVPPPAFRYVLLIGLSKFKLTSNGRWKGFSRKSPRYQMMMEVKFRILFHPITVFWRDVRSCVYFPVTAPLYAQQVLRYVPLTEPFGLYHLQDEFLNYKSAMYCK